MSDFGDSIGKAFRDFGSSFGEQLTSTFNQAASSVASSVPLMVAGGIVVVLVAIWLLRHI